MESIVPILIGAAFLILQIINSAKKKEAERQRMAPPMRPQVDFPPQPPQSQSQQHPIGQWLEIFDPTEEGPKMTEMVEAVSEVKNTRPSKHPKKIDETAMTNGGIQDTIDKITAGQSSEERIAFAERKKIFHWLFDDKSSAKKAIIYSEIMRPKFE